MSSFAILHSTLYSRVVYCHHALWRLIGHFQGKLHLADNYVNCQLWCYLKFPVNSYIQNNFKGLTLLQQSGYGSFFSKYSCAPRFKPKIFKSFVSKSNVDKDYWPSQSRDLNSQERIWTKLDQRLQKAALSDISV